MAESHNIAIRVDASQAKAELRDFNATLGLTARTINSMGSKSSSGFESMAKQFAHLSDGLKQLKAVGGIDSLGRELQMLGNGMAQMKAPSTANIKNIAALAGALKQLNGIKIPTGLGQGLEALGKGLANFRAPSANAIGRIPQLIAALQGVANVRITPSQTRNITDLGAALGTLRAPSQNVVTRLPQLMRALNNARINGNVAPGLAAISAAMSGFRGPSTAGVNNIIRLAQGLSMMNPGNINQITSALQRIQGLSVNIGRLQAQTGNASRGGAYFAGVSNGARGATGSLRGLENQFSATYHMASLLRTAMGALTLGALMTGIQKAGDSTLGLQRGLAAVAGSSGEVANQMAFLNQLTRDMPIGMEAATEAYRGFGISARSTGMELEKVQSMFRNFSIGFAGAGLNGEAQKGAFKAIEQIITKGKVTREELMQQLGDRFPAVVSMFAEALNVNPQEFLEKMERGIPASELSKLGVVAAEKFKGGLEGAMATSAGAMTIFNSEWFKLQNTVFSSGYDSGLAAFFQTINKSMQSEQFTEYAQKAGGAFQSIFATMGTFAKIALDNIDVIGKVVAAFAGMMVVMAVAKAMMLLASPLGIVAGAALLVYMFWDQLTVAFQSSEGPMATVRNTLEGIWNVLEKIGAVKAFTALFGSNGLGSSDTFTKDLDKLSPGFSDRFKVEWNKVFGGSSATAEAAKAGENAGKAVSNGVASGAASGGLFKQFSDAMSKLGESIGLSGDSGVMAEFKKTHAEILALIQKNAETTKVHGDHLKNNANYAALIAMQMSHLNDAQKKVVEDIMPWVKALRDAKNDLEIINGITGKKAMGGSTIFDADNVRKLYVEKNLEKLNPWAGQVRDMTQELQVLQKTGEAREIERKVLQVRNALLQQGVILENEQEQVVRRMAEAMAQLEKGGTNGFQRWAAGVKEFGEAIKDVEQNALKSLSDKLSEFMMKGKADWASMAQSMLSALNKAALESLMKDLFKGFGGEGLAGLLGFGSKVDPAKAIKDGQGIVDAAKSQIVGQMNVQAGTVNISGVGIPGLGQGGAGATGIPDAATSGGASTMSSAFGAPTSLGYGNVNPGVMGPTNIPAGAAAAAATTGAGVLGMSGNVGRQVFGLSATGVAGLGRDANGLVSNPAGVTSGNIGGPGLGMMQQHFGVTPMAVQTQGAGFGSMLGLRSGSANAAAPSGTTGQMAAGFVPAPNTASSIPMMAGGGAMGGIAAPLQSLAGAGGGLPQVGPRVPIRPNYFSATAGRGPEAAVNRQMNSPAMVEAYVRDAAIARGIDPDVAARVVRQESGFKYNATNFNPREKSYGPMQLNTQGGLGVHAMQKGIDVTDPSTWKKQVDFGMDVVKRDGWRQWYGARDVGISRWQGINRGANGPQANADLPAAGAQNAGANFMPPGMDMNTMNAAMPTAGAMPGQAAMREAMESSAAQFRSAMTPATQDIGQQLQGQVTQGIGGMGDMMQGAVGGASGALGGLTSGVSELGGAASGATGGLGSLISQLMNMGGGMMGGGGGGIGSMLGGLFKEGGISGSAVSSGSMPSSFWHGAPAYAEGTPNTSGGGMPAILHPNEAVIPLSKGRSVPVDLGDKNVDTPVNNSYHFHLNGVKDKDTFLKSKSQIQDALATMQARNAAG